MSVPPEESPSLVPLSPCIGVCTLETASRLCIGCGRSLEEIAGWRRLSPERQEAIRLELPDRLRGLRRRKGGRRARLAATSS